MRNVLVILTAIFLVGCSTDSNNTSADLQLDLTVDLSGSDEASPPVDIMPDGEAAEIVPEIVEPPPPRLLKFRAIGGVSMGAGALNFHAHNPGRVDVVAALGGYVNYSYVLDMLHRQLFGGFCSRELLLANLDDLNDPDAVNLQCGISMPEFPWEFAQNFNNIHPDYSGGTWHRDTYFNSIGALVTAFGNLFSYNPDNPILPPGIPAAWLADGDGAEKCTTPHSVGKPFNYNAEYNPEGLYPLITFCDGEEPIEGGEDNPDYWDLLGSYDPTMPHYRPVAFILAVDYNENGIRDYHEPVIINTHERFEDTGTDGCSNADEDGEGGCAGGGSGDDPNGDDLEMFDNPGGTEGDHIWQPGESYEDFGLDGVDGTDDFGEGDSEYSVSPHLRKLFDTTGLNWIKNAPEAEFSAVDVFLDAGIRDGLQSLTGTYRLGTALQAREPNTLIHDNFTGTSDSVYPSNSPIALNEVYEKVDWTAEGVGKNFLVTYGYENATPEAIKMGDGKHVGTAEQLFNRVAMFVYSALARWPDLDLEVCLAEPGKIFPSTFYSEALGARFGYSIAIPPCYESSGLTYPVIYFLPGQGMSAADVTITSFIFGFAMQAGTLPKFIEVAPEGQCCHIHKEAGTRYCACLDSETNGSLMDCVDPQCKAAHDECDIIEVLKKDLYQECPGGCVFSNQVSDVYGNVGSADKMRYEDMLLDLMDHVEATYRVRPGQK
jgi:hypothetical protein